MPRSPRLDDAAITAALEALPGWRREGDTLRRDFTFDSFARAFGFMASCALVAERLDHHPDWTNVYRRVHVTLTTHDSGGITERDLALARAMNALGEGPASA